MLKILTLFTKKNTPSIKVLHSLQGQFSKLQFFIFAGKESKFSACFISYSNKSQIFGPSILADSVPYEVVLTLSLKKVEACLKLYCKSRFVIKLPNTFSNILFSTL